MFINNKPFGKNDHIDHKAIYFYLSFFLRYEPVVFFGSVDTQKTHQEGSEKN
jgi:hypothetical protein